MTDDKKKSEYLLNLAESDQLQLTMTMEEMAAIGYWSFDRLTKQLFWSPGTYAIHEVEFGEAMDLPTSMKFFPEPERTTVQNAYAGCIEFLQPFDLEVPFISAKKREVWVRLTGKPLLIESNKATRVAGTIQDITVQKSRELVADLQASVLNNMSEGVNITNESNRIVFVNPALETMYGYESGELIGRDISVLRQASEDKISIDFNETRKKITEQGFYEIETVFKRKSSEQIHCHLRISEIHHQGQRFFIGVQRDLSQLREYEAKLEEQRVKAISSARLASLGEMAGGVAHEINNPLAVISSASHIINRMVRKKQLNPQKLQDISNKLITTVERIERIIKGLRDFSRDRPDNEDFEVISAQEIIESTLSFCEEKFQNYGVRVTVRPQNLGALVECQPTRISQIVLNLLNNAFDSVEEKEEPWITIAVNQDAERLWFEVTDSGDGVEPDKMEKIMQPFFTTKDIGKGTGLGLSISAGIAQSHGGSLEFISNAPTLFRLTIPKRRKKSSSDAA